MRGQGKMNKIIITSGYMGSGSSAITELVSEIENFIAPNNSFEYVFLHCPNGVFDLEDKLLLNNNSNRSDEAIRSFYDTMRCLFQINSKNYWVAGYKHNVSADFMKYVDAFLEEIGMIDTKGVWYYQQRPTRNMLVRIWINRIIRKCSLGKLVMETPLRYRGMRLAFPKASEFYRAARNFIGCVLDDLGYSQNNLIMDQFMLPHNLYRISNYFPKNTVVIVVDRDPRDVFISNKYFWKKEPIPYPLDVEKFCEVYKRIRENEIACVDNQIIRIHFEDLIYKYDEICNMLYRRLDISGDRHIEKKAKFNPEISINNTQLYKMEDSFQEETNYIEQHLDKYCYDFPYVFDKSERKVF